MSVMHLFCNTANVMPYCWGFRPTWQLAFLTLAFRRNQCAYKAETMLVPGRRQFWSNENRYRRPQTYIFYDHTQPHFLCASFIFQVVQDQAHVHQAGVTRRRQVTGSSSTLFHSKAFRTQIRHVGWHSWGVSPPHKSPLQRQACKPHYLWGDP